MFNFKTLAGAVVALGMSTLASNAAVVDFTDSSAFSNGDLSEVIDGVLVTISSSPAGLNFDDKVRVTDDAFCSDATFACDNDGAGIIDDEISNPDGISQSITVTFSRAVDILSFGGLDLYADDDGEVLIGVTDGGVMGAATATELFELGGNGDAFVVLDINLSTSILFTVSTGNDALGVADGSLSYIQFEAAPIPLPAGVLLLGGALAGLGMMRRKS